MTGFIKGVKSNAKYSLRDHNGLHLDDIIAAIPAISADTAHHSRSKRYVPTPTLNVVAGLMNEGFVPVEAMQAAPRKLDKIEFAKHLIKFRRNNELGNAKPDVREIILLNSSDGSSSYQMMTGVFRMVCTNGLISAELEDDYRVRHSGTAVNDVIECAYRVLDNDERVYNTIGEFKGTTLTPQEKMLLAEFAHKARFNIHQDENISDHPIKAQQFLQPRRYEDKADDMYTVMNVIQENGIKGGLRGYDFSSNTRRPKRTTTRSVNGIDQSVSFNKLLWAFTERLAEVKGIKLG